jgi:hypothetical protein
MSRGEVPNFRPFVGQHCETEDAAEEWGAIAALIDSSARTAEAGPQRDAAQRCRRVAGLEVAAMRQLVAL